MSQPRSTMVSGHLKYHVEYKYRQDWFVDNFDKLSTVPEGQDPQRVIIRSQSFYSPNDGSDYEWRLVLYPNGIEDKNYMSLFIEYMDDDNVIASVRLMILDINGNSCVEAYARGKGFHAEDRIFGATRMMPKYMLNESCDVMRNQRLHIVCEVAFDYVPKETRRLVQLTWRSLEFESYNRMYNDGEPGPDKDVVLTTSDKKKLHLHKLILQTRSQILKTMLELKRPENGKLHITIEDYDCNTLREVCRFIYCGRVENIREHAEDMMVAAKSLEMPGLSSLCEQCLIDNITHDKAINYLRLADKIDSVDLKEKTLNYIALNSGKVVYAQNFEKSCENLRKKTMTEMIQVLSDMIGKAGHDDEDAPEN